MGVGQVMGVVLLWIAAAAACAWLEARYLGVAFRAAFWRELRVTALAMLIGLFLLWRHRAGAGEP